MCKVLEVSKSGYYAYEKRIKVKKEKNIIDEKLIIMIKLISNQSRSSYGSRRIAKALTEYGYIVGRYKVRKLMYKANVYAKQRRRYKQTTDSNHSYRVYSNNLNRKFDVEAPNLSWVSDITYIPTQQGWLYLAAVIDLYSRKVIGWGFSEKMTSELPIKALKMALGRRNPQFGLLHHSDRGSQYASFSYQNLLQKNGIVSSMSRKGNCWDNAVMERFFGSLKSECINNKKYSTRDQAKADIIDYIEMFYNSKRLHSTLGYMSPQKYELVNVHLF